MHWTHSITGRLGLSALLSLALSAIVFFAATERWQGLNIDLLNFARYQTSALPDPAAASRSKTVVIAIDERTYRAEGFVGRPRVLWTPEMAQVQNAVLDAGARVFAWDIVLPTSAAAWTADRRYDRDLLLSLHKHGGVGGKVILGEAAFGESRITPFAGFVRANGGVKNLSLVNAVADADDVIRAVPLFGHDPNRGSRATPTMALEVAARWLTETPRLERGTAWLAGREIPGGARNRLEVNFDPGTPIPVYSFADVHRCAAGAQAGELGERFKDRAVLLGLVLDVEDRKVTSDRLYERSNAVYASACDGASVEGLSVDRAHGTSGVLILANAVNNLLDGSALRRVAAPTAFLALLGVTFFALDLGLLLRPGPAILVGGLGVLVGALGGVIAFEALGLVLPLVEAGASGAVAFALGLGFRAGVLDRQRRQLHRSFARYLDRDVIELMLKDGDVPELGGEAREMSVLFSDIAAFSSLSETLSPEALVSFLNVYFTEFGKAVRANHGMIERFTGDAVIALFGAPRRSARHAEDAVCAALDARAALAALKDPLGGTVTTRFGINSGVMTVGNVGAERRFAYTAIGDAVNLAARLEGANKMFGTEILVGARTHELARPAFDWRQVVTVCVAGRSAPEDLWEPLDRRGETAPELLRARALCAAAAERFGQGEPEAALRMLGDRDGEADIARSKLAEFIRMHAATAAQQGWDGIIQLDEK